jgi:phage FluMu gp28-like protein
MQVCSHLKLKKKQYTFLDAPQGSRAFHQATSCLAHPIQISRSARTSWMNFELGVAPFKVISVISGREALMTKCQQISRVAHKKQLAVFLLARAHADILKRIHDITLSAKSPEKEQIFKCAII